MRDNLLLVLFGGLNGAATYLPHSVAGASALMEESFGIHLGRHNCLNKEI